MKILITLGLLTFASFALVAQEDLISKFDLDSDGKISIEEASTSPSLSAIFNELDEDGDGYLSVEEIKDL